MLTYLNIVLAHFLTMSIHKNTGFLNTIVFSLYKSSEFQLFKQPLEVKPNRLKVDCCLVPRSLRRLTEDPIKSLYSSAKQLHQEDSYNFGKG